jgi:hypothetical protein
MRPTHAHSGTDVWLKGLKFALVVSAYILSLSFCAMLQGESLARILP